MGTNSQADARSSAGGNLGRPFFPYIGRDRSVRIAASCAVQGNRFGAVAVAVGHSLVRAGISDWRLVAGTAALGNRNGLNYRAVCPAGGHGHCASCNVELCVVVRLIRFDDVRIGIVWGIQRSAAAAGSKVLDPFNDRTGIVMVMSVEVHLYPILLQDGMDDVLDRGVVRMSAGAPPRLMAHNNLPRLGCGGKVVDQPVVLSRAGGKGSILIYHYEMDRAVIVGPVVVSHVWIREVLVEHRACTLMVAPCRNNRELGLESVQLRVGGTGNEEFRGPVALGIASNYIPAVQENGLIGWVGSISRTYPGSYRLLGTYVSASVAVGEELHGCSGSRRRSTERTSLTVYL